MVPTIPAYTYRAKFLNNHDGDTVRLDLDLGMDIWFRNQAIRLYGVNTPELKGETLEAAKKARDFVNARLSAAVDIIVETIKDRTEKYGRWLARIHYATSIDGGKQAVWRTINDDLLTEGMAVVMKG
jgi:micrococcal nuclease